MRNSEPNKWIRLGLAAMLAASFWIFSAGCDDKPKEDELVIPGERPPATAGHQR